MTTNMGKVDRGVRLTVAALLLLFVFATAMAGSGVLFWLALILAAVFTLTAAAGNCPLYGIIGLKTCRDC